MVKMRLDGQPCRVLLVSVLPCINLSLTLWAVVRGATCNDSEPSIVGATSSDWARDS